jgi:16S rRNA (adenine1518-N6/adenine1519-N6)-dimethyltransferase
LAQGVHSDAANTICMLSFTSDLYVRFPISTKPLVYTKACRTDCTALLHMKRKPKLGQNFLVDDAARHAIVDALGDVKDRTVIEIGPGHGAITEILAGRCRRLVALELDSALAAELRFRFRDRPEVEIVEVDVLKAELRSLVPEGETADVVGNLPYYITSDILLQLFAAGSAGLLSRAVLMMQREVADRVSAAPGVRDYGLLSATAQMNARVDHLFVLPPSAFSPPPEVYSTVLRLEFAPRFAELGVDAAGFDAFLKQSFAQKRKTLNNNLRAAGYSAEQVAAAWPPSIPQLARAESLGLEAMAELYRSLGRSATSVLRLTLEADCS